MTENVDATQLPTFDNPVLPSIMYFEHDEKWHVDHERTTLHRDYLQGITEQLYECARTNGLTDVIGDDMQAEKGKHIIHLKDIERRIGTSLERRSGDFLYDISDTGMQLHFSLGGISARLTHIQYHLSNPDVIDAIDDIITHLPTLVSLESYQNEHHEHHSDERLTRHVKKVIHEKFQTDILPDRLVQLYDYYIEIRKRIMFRDHLKSKGYRVQSGTVLDQQLFELFEEKWNQAVSQPKQSEHAT